jgi:hypothetical protein
MSRVYLSPPHLTGDEQELVNEAFASNWIAPIGPHVDAFEREMCDRVGVAHATALSSGTGALHLGMRLLGVGVGDEVLCSSLTFSASANTIVYERASPVFVDCDASWTLDPNLVEDGLRAAAEKDSAAGRVPGHGEPPHQPDGADQGEGDREEGEEQLHRGLRVGVEEDEDQDDRDGDDRLQSLPDAQDVLVLAASEEGRSRRELDRGGDRRVGLFDVGADDAPRDVREDVGGQYPVLVTSASPPPRPGSAPGIRP